MKTLYRARYGIKNRVVPRYLTQGRTDPKRFIAALHHEPIPLPEVKWQRSPNSSRKNRSN